MNAMLNYQRNDGSQISLFPSFINETEEVKQTNKMKSNLNWDEPDFPEKHDFDKLPVAEGVLVKRDEIVIKGELVGLIVLDTPAGLRTIWLGAVLKSSMEEKDPKVGDYVGVKYLGMKEAASGLSYRNFATRVLPKEVEE